MDEWTHEGLSALERTMLRSVAFVQELDVRLPHRP